MTPKVQHFIDMQQDFFAVCMLIGFIAFHSVNQKKKAEQKERVEKPQILNIYISGARLCVYFLRDFTFDVILGGDG